MKKLLGLGAVVALIASAVAVGTASAASITPGACTGGKMIVNVTYNLYNDADSGFYSPQWATDSLNRVVKVFDLGGGSYCATVNDTGSFVTTGPVSPEKGVFLAAGIKGVINGGYATDTFTGTLATNPPYATRGNLGSFDANGSHPSFLSYFSSNAWDGGQPGWGWTYRTAQNGNWVNAESGSFGDITGS